MDATGDTPQLTLVESVSCLGCGAVYGKPLGGGTVRENPGCPQCGYVGWMPTSLPAFSEELLLRRSAAGHPQHHAG